MRMLKNPFKLISEFKEFARTMTPEEAEKQVRELVNSGRINKQMFNDIKEQAEMLQSLLRR
jgi:hypothetical protein